MPLLLSSVARSYALLIVTTVPRVVQLAVKPDTVYPLFGLRHAAERAVARMTNRPMLTGLFGDSSYVVNYVRAIGYKQPQVQQTGSNLGTGFKHDSPFLSTIGSGTMIADGVSFMNTDFSATSFKVSRAAIGAHNFLGNAVLFPAGARTGDNCLLATKVMVPLDGPLRHDVGLLGSPPFEIPRSVLRDALPEEHSKPCALPSGPGSQEQAQPAHDGPLDAGAVAQRLTGPRSLCSPPSNCPINSVSLPSARRSS